MAVRIIVGDCRETLRTLPAGSVQTCVTSPPYFGLRDYGHEGQIGLEETPDAYVAEMVSVFREVRRVLRDDGTLWLNLGDSYASTGGHTSQGAGSQRAGRSNIEVQNARKGFGGGGDIKVKDLIGIPWRVAFALQADGWYLRSSIIWHKPNPMPESVTDRPTNAHENIFLLTKAERYFYDAEAVREAASQPVGQPKLTAQHKRSVLQDTSSSTLGTNQGEPFRNLRNVWSVATQPFTGSHFATFPPALIEPCIKAGSREGDTVLDPFGGAGTTGLVADRLRREAILCELNPDYAEMARGRLIAEAGMFGVVEVSPVIPLGEHPRL